MKLCIAQTRPIRGDISRNMGVHKQLIDLAVSQGADAVIFPELSLTGYEPTLAKRLATCPDDRRFDDFQTLADANELTIGVGVPTESNRGISITMVLFQPHQARQTYSKRYLHADEEAFFVSGQGSLGFIGDKANIALAICYEISVPEHAESAYRSGAEIYIASVAKSASGVEQAAQRLADVAKKYSLTVLMANCVGRCDDFECGGRSSIWNQQGILVGQLNDSQEGIIMLDTDTQELIEESL